MKILALRLIKKNYLFFLTIIKTVISKINIRLQARLNTIQRTEMTMFT